MDVSAEEIDHLFGPRHKSADPIADRRSMEDHASNVLDVCHAFIGWHAEDLFRYYPADEKCPFPRRVYVWALIRLLPMCVLKKLVKVEMHDVCRAAVEDTMRTTFLRQTMLWRVDSALAEQRVRDADPKVRGAATHAHSLTCLCVWQSYTPHPFLEIGDIAMLALKRDAKVFAIDTKKITYTFASVAEMGPPHTGAHAAYTVLMMCVCVHG